MKIKELTTETLENLLDGFLNQGFQNTYLYNIKQNFDINDVPEIQNELNKRKNSETYRS